LGLQIFSDSMTPSTQPIPRRGPTPAPRLPACAGAGVAVNLVASVVASVVATFVAAVVASKAAGPLRAALALLALAVLSSLAGCAGGAGVQPQEPPVARAEPADQPPAPPVPERPIPEDSVYPLLVAEFALRRRDFDTALQTYLEQADVLRDPAVSRHATHLAQYMQREREAFRAVRLWVELEPDNVEANGTLATLLARQGRTREALPHLAVVARSGNPAKFPILLNRFKALPHSEQAALDADVAALIAGEFPDNTSLLLTHALMAEEAGNPEEALARLAPIFELDPYQEQAVLMEAKIMVARGDDRPFRRIRAALKDDPARSELRLQYARLLAGRDMDAARGQFEILSADNPENVDLLFSLAVLNRELDDLDAAEGYLQRVLALDERRDEAYFFLGQIARGRGDDELALDHFRQVGEGSEFVKATVSIGEVLLAQERGEEFASYMARLRESYPQRREQLYALEANLLGQREQDEAGLALLNEAIDEFPGSDNLRYARSIVHERQGDIAAAEMDLRAIIRRDPNNATALNALGYTLANRTERYGEARVLIEKALRLQPNEPAILDSMGWVLYRQGEYEQALQFLTRAYAAFPDPEVAAHLGEVMWVSGNTAGAMNIWRGALLKDPQHSVLNATLDRLGITLKAEADTTP
jgi:tetratricopeptide (TPR) repeat protein